MGESTTTQAGMDLLLLNKQTGKVGQWIFKVVHSQVVSYSYPWGGSTVATKKLQVVFLSADEHKYCLGVMKAIKSNFQELENAMKNAWKPGTIVRATKVGLHNDKTNFVHTSIKSVIDLRQTTFSTLLTAPANFPAAASPPAPVADVVQFKLQKKEKRFFDVLGYASVSEVRYAIVAGQLKAIADVEIVDGSVTAAGKTATCNFTMFIPTPSNTECPQILKDLKSSISKPLAFFALAASGEDNGELKIFSSSEFSWKVAHGTKAEQLVSKPELQSLAADAKESLTAVSTWVPNSRRDFLLELCPQSAVALINTYAGSNSQVAKDIVHQLNFVEVEPPAMGMNVWTQNKERIWLKSVRIHDLTGSADVGMREKAALQLAGLDPDDAESRIKFEKLVSLGHLQFPLLCSVRINTILRSSNESSGSQSDDHAEVNKVIVEATEQDMAATPNKAYLDLVPFIQHCPNEAEGIIPACLNSITSASHYPLQIDYCGNTRPCSKALVLVEVTERTHAEKLSENANRLTTKNVKDCLSSKAVEKYNLVTMCDDIKSPTAILTIPRTGIRKQVAFAVVTGIIAPATFLVESVQPVGQNEVDATLKTFQKLLALGRLAQPKGSTKRPTWNADMNPVVAAKKCRTICASPSDVSLPDIGDGSSCKADEAKAQ